jgi:hypothetical protein
VKRYRHHKYTWTKPFTSVRHQWEVIGPVGAIHFHVSIQDDKKYEPSAGLEIHYSSPPDYMRGEAPTHVKCWLNGGPCWHDGTSLYASEHLWPIIECYLKGGEHEKIFAVLEREADDRFGFTNSSEDEEQSA